jgi:hypothetical protein
MCRDEEGVPVARVRLQASSFNARIIDGWMKEKDAASEERVRNQEGDELEKNGQGGGTVPVRRHAHRKASHALS